MAQHINAIEAGEIVVLFEDECHLLWGDVCGLAWGPRNEPISVPIGNQKARQTYYGAVNYLTYKFHLQPYSAGNGENTVAYIEWLRSLYPDAQIWIIWDGASYHRFCETRDYLATLNANLPEHDWPVTCFLFAPNAPEQNPVEDIWLKGKNWLRKQFAFNKTFADVKQCFFDFLRDGIFPSEKHAWYSPDPQII